MLGTTDWALGRRGRSAKRPNDHRSARSENDESQDPHHNAGNGRAPEPKEADLECCTGRDKHLLLRWRKERRHWYPDPAVPSVTAIRGQAPLRDGHRAGWCGDERLLAAFTKALLVGLASQFLRGQAHGVTAKCESLICRLSLVGSDAESRGSSDRLLRDLVLRTESHLRDQVIFVAMKVCGHLRHELGRKSLDMLEVADLDVALLA